VTHERDLGKNLSFLCAQNCLILLCISHHAALWPARSSRLSLVPLSRRSLSREVLFLRADVLGSFLFSLASPSSYHLSFTPSLFHLRSLLPPSPSPLSINLFFSLRSSGPRNEQRKSIGWHCGFVPSTVVLDLCVGTMCGTCFLMKPLLSLYIFCILHL